MCGPYPYSVWTIDQGEGELAGRFLLRCYSVTTAGVYPGRHTCICADLEQARESVPRDCNHFEVRRAGDRPSLVETWG